MFVCTWLSDWCHQALGDLAESIDYGANGWGTVVWERLFDLPLRLFRPVPFDVMKSCDEKVLDDTWGGIRSGGVGVGVVSRR